MQHTKIYVSELSTSKHHYSNYHFCRGNSKRGKTRIGMILRGNGTYLYFNKKLSVAEGDLVMIPENIYCYSEWHGCPDIEVLYVSCFMHYESFFYEPQLLTADEETKEMLCEISRRLTLGGLDELEAYSLFYKVLQKILPQMRPSTLSHHKTIQLAMEYITTHWNQPFSVGDIAKKCCVSESTLYHLFQKELGQTPIQFLNSIKINIAMEYLENSQYSIATISSLAGFPSENHFRKVFLRITGLTPLNFRKKS